MGTTGAVPRRRYSQGLLQDLLSRHVPPMTETPSPCLSLRLSKAINITVLLDVGAPSVGLSEHLKGDVR